jgi:hypothetical protein
VSHDGSGSEPKKLERECFRAGYDSKMVGWIVSGNLPEAGVFTKA